PLARDHRLPAARVPGPLPASPLEGRSARRTQIRLVPARDHHPCGLGGPPHRPRRRVPELPGHRVRGRRAAGELRFPGGEPDLARLALAPGTHELSLLVVALPLNGVMMSYPDSASARQVKGAVPRRGLCGDVSLVAAPASARIEGVRV